MKADPKDKMGAIARGYAAARGDKKSQPEAPKRKAPAHGQKGAYCQECGKRMPPPPAGENDGDADDMQSGNLGAGGSTP